MRAGAISRSKAAGVTSIDKNCVNLLFGPACVHEMRNLSSGSKISSAPVFDSTCIGVADVEKFSRLLLGGYTGFLDEVDIRLRAAVTDRRLVCVHFHNGVVHAHCPKRGEDVLDCMHAHRAFANRRGAFDRL